MHPDDRPIIPRVLVSRFHLQCIMPSSAHNQKQHLPNIYTAISAPPPTPSAQPNSHHITSSAAVDALSRLFHRLPPALSPPTRRSSLPTSPPLISLSDLNSGDKLLSASFQLGFFQLTDHGISSELANSAESESLSLFELTTDQKQSYFPRNWPIGFEEDEDGNGESFWLDVACSTEATELSMSSLRELTRALEKVGVETIEMLSRAVGFENPLKEDPTQICSLMVVHEGSYGDKPAISDGCYPYIVGLQFEIRSQKKYSLLADSGWVWVLPQPDSVMVTLGDIAQVWSNGKLKKVRGRPLACMGDGNNSNCISMTLLISLPTESTVSPLLPKLDISNNGHNDDDDGNEEDSNDSNNIVNKEKRLFSSFSFEDYAWRVYHEPLLFKDPLDKYRIST